MSENLRTYTKALYGFDAAVSRVEPDAWDNQSPCEDWTATDVVAHNVGMNNMVAGFTRGIGAGRPDHGLEGNPADAWRASLEGLLGALDRAGALQTVAKTPWGEMATDKFLGFAWLDPVIHTWDLAVATGQPPVLDTALVARGEKQLIRAGDSLRAPGRFGAEVQLGADVSTLDHFVALSGRRPQAG